MARPKSDLVKAMGAAWEIFQAIVNEVLTLGGNDEHLRRILTNKELRTQIAKLIMGADVVVTRTLASLISACKFDWVNANITEVHFPIPADFQFGAETKLFEFDSDTSSENAIVYIRLEGWRVATIFDLLVYAEKNPDIQRQFPIIALDSVCGVGGSRLVACLDSDGSGRGLSLSWFHDDWLAGYRFLAVRN